MGENASERAGVFVVFILVLACEILLLVCG